MDLHDRAAYRPVGMPPCRCFIILNFRDLLKSPNAIYVFKAIRYAYARVGLLTQASHKCIPSLREMFEYRPEKTNDPDTYFADGFD